MDHLCDSAKRPYGSKKSSLFYNVISNTTFGAFTAVCDRSEPGIGGNRRGRAGAVAAGGIRGERRQATAPCEYRRRPFGRGGSGKVSLPRPVGSNSGGDSGGRQVEASGVPAARGRRIDVDRQRIFLL